MIRQAAFVAGNKMLKGALHCHTTRSDGNCTPEEVMKIHKVHGYDFMAITDHRRYNYINFVPETGITLIPGMEFDNDISIPCDHGFRTFHTVCIGPLKEDGNGFEQDVLLDSANAPDQESYQPYLDDIHAKKNLTVYCHPQWSSTPPRFFEKMKGNFAMEIWNSDSALGCEMDYNAAYWDDLLGKNIRIFGVATDDGHSAIRHCNGWVMVNAENNVNAILKALENGEFYSSCGPEIYDFYYEDGKVVIDCSPVQSVTIHSDCHPNFRKTATDEPLTHVEFTLNGFSKFPFKYVRLSIMDKNGKRAWTNPIFLD